MIRFSKSLIKNKDMTNSSSIRLHRQQRCKWTIFHSSRKYQMHLCWKTWSNNKLRRRTSKLWTWYNRRSMTRVLLILCPRSSRRIAWALEIFRKDWQLWIKKPCFSRKLDFKFRRDQSQMRMLIRLMMRLIRLLKLKRRFLLTIWTIWITRSKMFSESIWPKCRIQITIWTYSIYWRRQIIWELLRENSKLPNNFRPARKTANRDYLEEMKTHTNKIISFAQTMKFFACKHNMEVHQITLSERRILWEMMWTIINLTNVDRLGSTIYLTVRLSATNKLWGGAKCNWTFQSTISVIRRLPIGIQIVSFTELTSIWMRVKEPGATTNKSLQTLWTSIPWHINS